MLQVTDSRLADGQWHRLHPATPLLRGGIAFVAILGVIAINFRDRVINLAIGEGPGEGYDPFSWVLQHDLAPTALAILAGGLLVFVAGFTISWRMHTFRITDEQVEVRSGVLFRTNRRGRLDRIQAINIGRPVLARIVGAAKLEINVAGQDANVQLAYLGSAAADELRREILLLASGTRSQAAAATDAATGGLISRRVGEFLAPELAADAAAPESVVQLHLGRLVGSLVLSGFTVFAIIAAAAVIAFTAGTHQFILLITIVPGLIGALGFYVRRFTRSVRYSIADTPDGVRVGFGLLSTSNETLPPGRIHAIEIVQPLLWRPAGWWEIRINRASASKKSGAGGQADTTILPVGNLADVHRVLELLLPGMMGPDTRHLLQTGLVSRGGSDGFTNSPRRAAWLRPLSWRRNGYLLDRELVLLRRGRLHRTLVIVPLARIQSISLHQGPILRALAVGSVHLHTVAGPVSAHLGGVDGTALSGLFRDLARGAVDSAVNDSSHRWRAGAGDPMSDRPRLRPTLPAALGG